VKGIDEMEFYTERQRDSRHVGADPSVVAALARRCELCGANPGKDCRNTVDGRKLPGRVVHHYRVKETGK
jgi:hypothetical protein